MRLDKYLCSCSELSRIDAKRNIGKGKVTVNGETVTNPATKIKDSDTICLNDLPMSLLTERYIMLHKPVNYICSNVDEAHPSVLNLIDVQKKQTLHVAGRLDVDTTGLVLITDDGQWSHDLTSPRKKCSKRYRVGLKDPVDDSAIALFAQGIALNNEPNLTRPAELEILSPHEVLLTLHEGKYHQVKRMFAAIGNKVIELHRESVGKVTLGDDLAPGEWRYLTDDEVNL